AFPSRRDRRTAGRTNRAGTCHAGCLPRASTRPDWPVDMLRDLDGANDAVALEPAAKPTADKVIVVHDLVRWQARGFRRGRLDACNGLAADPDFAGVLANMHRAVHRLHRCMREKRELVGCLDLGDGTCQGFVDIADVLSHRP